MHAGDVFRILTLTNKMTKAVKTPLRKMNFRSLSRLFSLGQFVKCTAEMQVANFLEFSYSISKSERKWMSNFSRSVMHAFFSFFVCSSPIFRREEKLLQTNVQENIKYNSTTCKAIKFCQQNPYVCSFSIQFIFFLSEQPFQENYSTLDSHTFTVISQKPFKAHGKY